MTHTQAIELETKELDKCDPAQLEMAVMFESADRKLDIHHLILDCSGVNFVDAMGVKAFREVRSSR